jgi:DNA-binding transcriptional ArsR family regulator
MYAGGANVGAMNSNERLTSEQMARGARVIQALAHPLRMAIMQELMDGELTCAQLQERVGCAQSTLSLQLKLLVDQGLVATSKSGTTKHCAIRNRDFLKLFTCLQKHLTEVL